MVMIASAKRMIFIIVVLLCEQTIGSRVPLRKDKTELFETLKQFASARISPIGPYGVNTHFLRNCWPSPALQRLI